MSYDFSGHESFVIAQAEKRERERILKLVENRICFDNKADGVCEHGYCYGLVDLKAAIQGVELNDE